ncbi:sensor histidine kinase [Paenibacillus sp. GCM10023248]|uniref:sensor histidine kinase n=1 Tax=Bacillales TaxID=1385 RepID=UPI002378BB99|nr:MULTISPECIES: histidine kinase [Bacillales]MDD9268966.1 histidine kinase [Paenibacillus sp. MAHUQ-63]MDR6885033.1 two-component system sensor histidine kinase YesM [Bacillus sp. 3255]
MRFNRYPFLHFSLRRKSIAIFVLLVTLPSLLIGNVILSRYDAILRQQFIDAMEKNLNTIELNLSEKIKTIEDLSDYMIYQENFRRFMETPTTPSNMEQMNKDQTVIEGFIAFQIMSKRYIKSISLQGTGGNQLQMGEPVKGLEQPWLDLAQSNKGRVIWTDSYKLESGWTGSKRVVSMVRTINSFETPSRSVGQVIVRLDESEITDLLRAAVLKDQGSIFMIRPGGSVLLHQDESLIGRPYPDEALLRGVNAGAANKVFSLEEDGVSYIVFSQRMKSTGWNIVALVKDQAIVQKTEAIKASLKFLILIIVILGLLALIGFEFAMIRPMLELSRQTQRLKKGDFSVQVKVRSQDEVGELGRQFNNMVMTIKELIDKKYKLEIRQKDSELRILQSQMDPHFLYNTLDMIRWTARLEKAPETSQLIETLSRFFRMGQISEKRYTTLAGELDFVRAYLNLQQKRMGSKLQFTLYLEAQLDNAVLLKKIIQPLVENSIKHGFPRGGGRIDVRCYTEEGDLFIDVLDSGIGFAKDKLEEIRQILITRKGNEDVMNHAICNIHERISLEYGSDYGITIPHEPSRAGACIRIRIPYWMNEQEGER